MNDLTLFLYFASVLPTLSGLIMFLGVLTLLGGVFICAMLQDLNRDKDIFAGLYLKKLLPLSIFCLVVAVMIPDKETMYLMAGSELSEKIITTPEGAEILSDIKLILKQKLQALKKD